MEKKHKIKEKTGSDYENLDDLSSDYPTVISVLNKVDEGIACYNLSKLRGELEDLLLHLMKRHETLLNKQSDLESFFCEMEENFMETVSEEQKVLASENKSPSTATQKNSFPVQAKSKMQSSKSQDYDFPLKSDVPKQQKSDSSNRFWSFIDAYCADTTSDDIKMLEKWIESHDQDSKYQDIPPVGVHYSSMWTKEDIMDEMKEGSKSVENPKGVNCSPIENSFIEELLNKYKNESSTQQPQLVQKLVSSLVQENIIASTDVMSEPSLENDMSEDIISDSICDNQLCENTLENRLRFQLEEIGVLEKLPKETDDELLIELKQLQALLIPVSKYNLQKKQELLVRAKAEIVKQEAQKRIHEVDAKVMESYRTMSAVRSKGKKISKKEFYQIKTLLEERKMLVKNLNIGI